jgi:hypothetical protein
MTPILPSKHKGLTTRKCKRPNLFRGPDGLTTLGPYSLSISAFLHPVPKPSIGMTPVAAEVRRQTSHPPFTVTPWPLFVDFVPFVVN